MVVRADNGWTHEQILANYPGLTVADIRACLAYATEVLQDERVFPRAIQECEPRRIAVLADLDGCRRADSVAFLGWDARRYTNLRHRGLADLRRCLKE